MSNDRGYIERNPSTGEAVSVPTRVAMHFKAGPDLRGRLMLRDLFITPSKTYRQKKSGTLAGFMRRKLLQ